MAEHSGWKPDQEQALKALIKQTIIAAGPVGADELPHIVRKRLEGQAFGTLNVDDYVKQVQAELKAKDK